MLISFAHADEAYALASILPESVISEASAFTLKRRKSYLSSRVLLSLMLTHLLGSDFKGRFPQTAKLKGGKPVFIESRYPAFNISHSKDVICAAVSLDTDCAGVDIEYIKERVNLRALADRVMSDPEREHMRALDDKDAPEFFTAMWTAREALVKASGRGLADMQHIVLDPEAKKIIYYPLHSGLSLKTIRFDALLSEEAPSYLSYVSSKDEQCGFFTLKQGQLSQVSFSGSVCEFDICSQMALS